MITSIFVFWPLCLISQPYKQPVIITHTHTLIYRLSSLCLSGFIHSGSYVEGTLSQTKFSFLKRVYGVVLYGKIKVGSLVLIPSGYPSGPAVYLLNQKFFVQVTNIFKKLSKSFLYINDYFFKNLNKQHHLHHSLTAWHYQNKDDLYKHLDQNETCSCSLNFNGIKRCGVVPECKDVGHYFLLCAFI